MRPANRFEAMDDALGLLKGYGYDPRVIIDGGANVGTWTRMAHGLFPAAYIHMVEPQPACHEELELLRQAVPNVELHPVALAEPGVNRVRMIGGGEAGGGTGAWIARPDEHTAGEIMAPAATLDDLFASRITVDDRALLKLDLEHSEIPALNGASALLKKIEVILTEVQFFAVNDNGREVFGDVLNYLEERGFELYDIACLSQRPSDFRLRMGDVVFVRRGSQLLADTGWE
jgi:FkbM family methyltransferase